MSGPFALAAVSAVLRRLILEQLGDADLASFGNIRATALPPDQITTGVQEAPQLNLFLYQVTPNPGWRNVGLASRGAGDERLTNPPLALDLHYLLSAYGAAELQPEALLGYAMQVLHEVPFLSRDFIRGTWPGGGSDPVEQALAASNLAEQIEQIKITPQTLTTEEMSKLWSATTARFRPSAAYLVSVVLIESVKATKSPLPVLQQGKGDSGPSAQADLVPPFPEITDVTLPKRQPAALLDDPVKLSGHDFAGEKDDPTQVAVTVRLVNDRAGVARPVVVPANERTADEINFKVPNDPAGVPAGVYRMWVQVEPNGKPEEARESSEVALFVAPKITTDLTAPVARTNVDMTTGLGDADITLAVTPEVRAGQRVSLGLGTRDIPAVEPVTPGANISFHAAGVAAGKYRVRLRVDGVDSLFIDRSDPKNLKFDDTQQLQIT